MSVNKICIECGNPFFRPRKLSDKQWSGRKYCSKRCAGIRRKISNDELVARYQSGESSGDISKDAGVSATQVRRVLHSLGAEVRSLSAAISISHAKPEVKKKISKTSTGRRHSESAKEKLRSIYGPSHPLWQGGKTFLSSGYAAYTNSRFNGDRAGRTVHRVLAEKRAGRKLDRMEYVHHIDHNKRNNNLSNLKIMSARDHAIHHAQHRKHGGTNV